MYRNDGHLKKNQLEESGVYEYNKYVAQSTFALTLDVITVRINHKGQKEANIVQITQRLRRYR